MPSARKVENLSPAFAPMRYDIVGAAVNVIHPFTFSERYPANTKRCEFVSYFIE